MQYSELSYFLFLPLVMLLYTFTPKKFRYITLLVASLFFFYTLSGKLLIYVVYSTLIMYFASLLIDHFNELEDNINEEMPKEEKKALKLKYNKYKKRYYTGSSYGSYSFTSQVYSCCKKKNTNW